MLPASDASDSLRHNLIVLRAEALTIINLFVGIAGYLWLALTIWPVTGLDTPWSVWLGVFLLLASTTVSFLARDERPVLATHCLVWGLWGAILGAVAGYSAPAVAYLLILPVTLASVLVDHGQVFVMAILSCLALVGTVMARDGLTLWLALVRQEVVFPLAIIAMVTVASWLSARNLYIALTWAWNGYRQARHNEELAREHQAELRRVLKALDETNYRLERAIYMATLARDQAVEARRLKQRFAQNISHELRTPLNLIVGFTELMVQSPEYYGSQLPPAYLRDLSIIHRNATHLQNLINDVLDLARIEGAQVSLVPALVHPGELVKEAVHTARSLIETRVLWLRVDIASDLPPLWLDPTRIRQVLFNLLNNAARYTPEGGVVVRVYREKNEVIFAVADTGVGIAAADLPNIFKEFYQIDGVARGQGGAGLGLAISQRFVKLHGGRIWVESEPGVGSTFYFSLPVQNFELEAAAARPGRHEEPIAYFQHDEEPVLLVVTPSASAAALLARHIRGYRTVVANSLEQARHQAGRLMPQALLIDRALGVGDEAGLLQLAREWRLSPGLLFSCPLPGEEPIRQHLAVDGYLIKPVTRAGVWDVLREFGEGVETILIVDDNRDFVRLMRRLLDSPVRRYQVQAAYTGLEALALLRHRPPDLIFLDLGLPDVDGRQLIGQIRSEAALAPIPIVVVSAQDEMDSLDILQGGLLVTRPDGLMPTELVQWIQQVLHANARRRGRLENDLDAAVAPQEQTTLHSVDEEG